MKNLIVNADDFGWTRGVNRGIVEAHRNGIVTSTSLLANGAAFADAVELAVKSPRLGVGVHLNLSDGQPVSAAATLKCLVNGAGEFEGGALKLLVKIVRGALRLEEVEREWDAQIQKIRGAGIRATHLDGHKHVHMLPGLFAVALKLARRHGIGAIRVSHEAAALRAAMSDGGGNKGKVIKQGLQARGLELLARESRTQATAVGIATTDYFCGIAQTGELTLEGVTKFLDELPEGTTEMMCHPGYKDRELEISRTRLQESREVEVEILTNIAIRNVVASRGIRLIDYSVVASAA